MKVKVQNRKTLEFKTVELKNETSMSPRTAIAAVNKAQLAGMLCIVSSADDPKQPAYVVLDNEANLLR